MDEEPEKEKEKEKERPDTPDLFSRFLPPVSDSVTKKNDDVGTERNDGGMFFFVPFFRFLKTASLVLTAGVVAGLCMLAIVYLTSAIEGETLRAINAASRSADTEINNALAPKPQVVLSS